MSEEIKEITYKKLSQIERFVGPDIEDAPDDCSPGSTFFEAQEGSDVGRLYVFDGTRWAEKQQRVTGITLEGENISIVDPETLGKEATLQILKAELAAIKSAQTDGSQKVQVSGTIVTLSQVGPNLTVTAGSSIDLLPMGSYQYTSIGILVAKAAVYAHTIQIEYAYNAFTPIGRYALQPVDSSTIRFYQSKEPITSDLFRVVYINNAATDHVINEATIVGIRG